MMKEHMRKLVKTIVTTARQCLTVLLLAGLTPTAKAETTTQTLKDLTPQAFLAVIRDPLRTDAWSKITGRILHARKEDDSMARGNVRLTIRLSPKKMITQITLNDQNTYILEQTYNKKNGKTTLDLEVPEQEQKPSLFDFGLQPDDLSFAFFYWDFVEELTTAHDVSNGLRVLKLANPRKKDHSVKVWFNAKHGFPIQASWMDPKGTVQRNLELKGAKRHKNGVWFVKEMRLEDGNEQWKTQVKFDYVEKNEIGQ